jgi:serine/threonine protein kinase
MQRVGTLFHMSPEMLECFESGEPIGRMTDIWSIGCVALEILGEGELKYRDKDGNKLPTLMSFNDFKKEVKAGGCPNMKTAKNAKNASISSGALLNMVIIPCLSRNPRDRPDAAELLSKLDNTQLIAEGTSCEQ